MALSPTEESLVRQLIAQNPALLNLASSESTIISKLGATKVSLSDLSAATALSDADLALVRQGLNDKSFALSILSDYVNGKLPAASETVAGVVKLATAALAIGLTDDTTALTPAKLADALDFTWQNRNETRAWGATYTNGNKIRRVMAGEHSANTNSRILLTVIIDGLSFGSTGTMSAGSTEGAGSTAFVYFEVPPGAIYSVERILTGTAIAGSFYWKEGE